MARKDLSSRRRRLSLRRPRDEDRLNALSDDLILQIVGRLDTRSALGAAALCRRWAHLPRELPALDLKVTDALPPRYRRWLDLLNEAVTSDELRGCSRRLRPIVGRYERRAMRAMVSSVRSLRARRHRRACSRLSLEFFAFSTSAAINRLVVDAVDSWGVEDLEVVAKSTEPITHLRPVYTFPRGRISRKPGESRLRSLKLVNCLPPPLEGFTALTTLLLRDLPCSTPAAVYEGVVAACPQLRVLHLVSCSFDKDTARWVVFDAPMSEIRELVADGPLMTVKLRSLPKLESLTAVDARVLLCSDADVPCLAHVSLVFSIGPLDNHSIVNHLIALFMLSLKDVAISLRNLILRFTGPEMWILPNLKNQFSLMPNLKKLLVADVPSSWDVSWPRILIQAAPLLESLHVHVSQSQCQHVEEPGRQNISSYLQMQQPSSSSSWQRHRHLKELVVVGFQSTSRIHHQLMYLVRFAVDTSTALRRVAVFKHGHVEDKGGPWDWEMVSKQSTWSNEEKLAVLDCCSTSTPQIEVLLG
ncbi:uncharacterized protein LOC119323306 [Triticum dicoccoides]|uniref:uncharacterized protein LOC119323306 n=1 Tax=Triticum dicoccoides TaxID=85692 RepID=UPI00188EC365|nr:uncharacterized protein LOC119323306 [Triticum dicoccoides]